MYTCSIFILLALPLLLSPRLFLFLSSPASSEGETDLRTSLTPLETLFSVHLGLGLLALSLGLMLGHPLLVPVTLLTSLSSLISYNTAGIGSVGTVVSIVSGFVGLWGSYVILFGGESSISKTTGADKRTSRFIFGNKAAASAQKKAWKKEHGAHDRSDS
ncbi:hypothetical protein BS47DRAFT_1351030 [Hydnum rufescens UP504]|uniref:Uncharacterized protein n=1 Tax=Hydnum rufescens UP504 TaxID=1448309 RepID=A0A9P6DNE1_9AGAM|nr:hypothetical protein BS47DRAFT_1351030 [Hydnum rufescens UP504]